jgi:hypothetical protein
MIGDTSALADAFIGGSPLPALTATIGVYIVACWIHTLAKRSPLANPVAISIAMLVTLLKLSGTPYSTYFEGAKFIHFLLGPAIIALAVPLHRQNAKAARCVGPVARRSGRWLGYGGCGRHSDNYADALPPVTRSHRLRPSQSLRPSQCWFPPK